MTTIHTSKGTWIGREALFSDPKSDVEKAFESGVLRLEFDKIGVPQNQRMSAYVSERPSDVVRFVHVMSSAVSGEIRGYALTEDGRLCLRLPCYTGDWPELDAAVVARVPGVSVLVVKSPGAGGM